MRSVAFDKLLEIFQWVENFFVDSAISIWFAAGFHWWRLQRVKGRSAVLAISAKISAVFTTVSYQENGRRAGRLQGLRAPPQINISFQPRQPPTATLSPYLPLASPSPGPTPGFLPLPSRPRVAASCSCHSSPPAVFRSCSSVLFPHPRILRFISLVFPPSLSRHSSLVFVLSPDDSVIAYSVLFSRHSKSHLSLIVSGKKIRFYTTVTSQSCLLETKRDTRCLNLR